MKTVCITVRIKLNKDLDEEQAEDLISSLDYEFKHESIESTEIIEDDISNRC